MDLTPRHRRLLERVADGDAPRASRAEYELLRTLPGLGSVLQMESAMGADTRAGYIITPLRSINETIAAVRAFLGSP